MTDDRAALADLLRAIAEVCRNPIRYARYESASGPQVDLCWCVMTPVTPFREPLHHTPPCSAVRAMLNASLRYQTSKPRFEPEDPGACGDLRTEVRILAANITRGMKFVDPDGYLCACNAGPGGSHTAACALLGFVAHQLRLLLGRAPR